MSLEVIYSPLALLGMNEIADYLAGENPRLGLRFLKAVEETCGKWPEIPEMAGRYESDDARLADLRVWTMAGFPNHLLFFRVKESRLEIAQVVYGGRDLDKVF